MLTQKSDEAPTYDNLGPAAYIIPIPLIVLWLCNPRQLMVWAALRWIAEVFPEIEQHGGPSYNLLAKLCKIDTRGLPSILKYLRHHHLVHDMGMSRVARAKDERPYYVIDADQVDDLTRSHFSTILARWHISTSRLPRLVPKEQLELFQSMTGASGITPLEATSASGIIPQEGSFTVVVKGHVPYMTIFVPLVVFDRCDPSEFATWITQCWLLTVKAGNSRDVSAKQVSQIGTLGRGKLSSYYTSLLNKRLVIHVGMSQEARNYVISHHRILILNAQEAGTILTKWKVIDPMPDGGTRHQQRSLLHNVMSASGITPLAATDASGITSTEILHRDAESTGASGITPLAATDASGITPLAATGASGIISAKNGTSLKRKKLKKGVVNDPIRDSFATPDDQSALHDHPLDLWQRLHPDATAADCERLRRTAAEHDTPHNAYEGGFGMYWLGRAIEAALANTSATPTLRYVRGILRSWRDRTTDDVSAYGSDAPNYRPRHSKRQVDVPAIAAQTAVPVQISPDLQALWARILEEVQQQVPAADFATWLCDCALLQLDAATAMVAVSNIFVRDRVAQDYATVLATALSAALNRPIAVEVVIDGNVAR